MNKTKTAARSGGFAALMRHLFCGGVTNAEYRDIIEPIRRENHRTWRVCSWVATGIFAGLFICSFFSRHFEGQGFPYAVGFVTTLVVAVIFRRIGRSSAAVLPTVYLQNILLFLVGIYISVAGDRDMIAVTFCVFLLAIPLMTLDRPWRIQLMLAAMTTVFSLCAFRFKANDVALTDTINASVFTVISMLINSYMTEQRFRTIQLRKKIELDRDTDDLTGLQNKFSLMRDIKKYLEEETDEGVFVIFDVDHFKSINDRYGHDVGDEILSKVGECIAETFDCSANICGRFGGDEFILFLRHTGDMGQAKVLCKKLLREVNRIELPDGGGFVHCSMGLALREKGTVDNEVLFRKADTALYQAKNTGRNRLYVYGSEIDDAPSAEVAANLAADAQTDTALMLEADRSSEEQAKEE